MVTARRLAFSEPPIWEVSLSVMTQPGMLVDYDVKGFHGSLADEYPRIEKAQGIDNLDPIKVGVGQPVPGVQLSFGQPLPRWWFSSAAGNMVVQAQENFVALNWRRMSLPPVGPTTYPGFDAMLERFKDVLGRLRTWHASEGRQLPVPVACSLLYDNLISMRDSAGDQVKVQDVFSRYVSDSATKMFNWTSSWVETIDAASRPESSSLTVLVNAGAVASPQSNELWPVLKMQFDSRYSVSSWDDAIDFFAKAHDITTERLTTLTTEKVRDTWKPL